jgi:hypothetical protein
VVSIFDNNFQFILEGRHSCVTSAISQQVERVLYSYFYIKFSRSIIGSVAIINSKFFYYSH